MRNWSIGWLLPTSTDGKRSLRARRPRAPAATARTAIGRFSARPSRRRRGRAGPRRIDLSRGFFSPIFLRVYNASAADHSAAAYPLFVRKTMQFVALQLATTFPDTPILPALGNNDEVCGDYRLQPDGPFLADTLPIVRTLVGSIARPG